MKKITLGFMMLIGGITQAQMTVDNTTFTPEQLTINDLVGQGVVPTNIFFNQPGRAKLINDQIGLWKTNNGPDDLGLGANQKGVILTTGQATVALGPNNNPGKSLITVTPSPPTEGDPDLLILNGGTPVKQVSILEFDFVATGNVLNFDYVFASEEYPEYVDSFNDVFGLFLSGPGIAEGGFFNNNAINLAQLPTTATLHSEVSINNVNHKRNIQYYVSNGDGTTPLVNSYTQYDGFTTLLNATSALQFGETYHIKLAIGNTGDNGWDSAVFMKNFSISNIDLGIKENVFDSKFAIYPNPSRDFVTISNASDILINEVKVIDLNGRTIQSNKFNNVTNVKLNISDINSGVYFLEITSGEGKAVKRLIKE